MSENASNRLRAERAEARVAELERAVARVRARIDAMKLKYRPNETAPEPSSQRPASEQEADATLPSTDN